MFSAFEVHGGIHALVSFCIRRGTIRGANGGGYTSCRSTISPTEKLILSHALRRMTAPSAEGAKLRFRLCGGEAVDGARLAAFRSPPPPLRAPTYRLVSNLRQYRTNELVRWRMHFLSDAIAEIEGLLEVNRDFCKKQMAEKASPALPTNCAVVPIITNSTETSPKTNISVSDFDANRRLPDYHHQGV